MGRGYKICRTNKQTHDELVLCRIIHCKLRSGDAISDEELKAGIKHYTKVVEFLEVIKNRSFNLFKNSLKDDLRRMIQYHEERKKQ